VPISPLARIALILIVCVFAGLAQPAKARAAEPTRAEKALIYAINNARANYGVRRLRVGPMLQEGSHYWARYLLVHDGFFHARIYATDVRENIAWLTCRSDWARTTVRMWLNSSVHRSALLDRTATRVGAGVATGSWRSYSCVRMSVARFR
jgi:uncharacterized protein YkwD